MMCAYPLDRYVLKQQHTLVAHGDEHTLAQHQSFFDYTALFEGFLEGFLANEGVSTKEFYDLVRLHLGLGGTSAHAADGVARDRAALHTADCAVADPKDAARSPWDARAAADKAAAATSAAEVFETIKCVADFNSWAARISAMNEERAQRRRWIAQRGTCP
jgi:hypothetical protein